MNTPACPPELNSVADLKALQRIMAGALFAPLGPGDRLRRTRDDGAKMKDVAASFMRPNSRLSPTDRLEIYARQYWFRVLDGLYDDFPGLRALLGQRKFHTLSRAYLARHPSESFTLRNLGSRLEGFLRDEPQLTAPWSAMALDMVRFEWAQTMAFDEGGLPPLDGDAMLGTPADELTLGLQPYLTLLELDYTVDTFFLAVRNNESGTRGEASNARDEATQRPPVRRVSKPKPARRHVAVHRFENLVFTKQLEPEAFALLSALRAGATLSTALEAALASADPDHDWAGTIRGWFETWSTLGWFCARA